ncbi:hypothetical protein C0J52_18956 [Blattella germanica]|nr:hypothetical protein C0J52_18956 [Blattella germanica]
MYRNVLCNKNNSYRAFSGEREPERAVCGRCVHYYVVNSWYFQVNWKKKLFLNTYPAFVMVIEEDERKTVGGLHVDGTESPRCMEERKDQ